MTYDGWDLHHVGLQVDTKTTAKLYDLIGQAAAEICGPDITAEYLAQSLSETERKSSFGLGRSVFMPGALIEGLDSPIYMFFRLKKPLALDTPDGRDVDHVFVLLSPAEDGPLHLRRLARISRLLSGENFVRTLRQMEEEDSVRSLFLYPDETELLKAA